jgi:adenylate kinase
MAAKIIVVTGISGSGSRAFCKRYEEQVDDTRVYHTGDMIFEAVQKPGQPRIPMENLLNMHPRILQEARDKTFRTIIENLSNDSRRYTRIIIDTHAQFFWDNVYTNAYDWAHLNKIPIDMFSTIIDKPSSIKDRQMQTPHGRAQKHDYRDLLLWQNVEMNMTQGWALHFNKPAYLFSSKQKPQDAESLLYNELLVYPSFAMTDASQDDTRKIESFKAKLRDSRKSIDNFQVPLNDPADIDIERDKGLSEAIKDTIDRQTIIRDYKYIWQGTHTIAYCPSVKTPVSKGQGDEIKEAHDLGKYVFLVSPKPKEELSPFYKYVHGIFKEDEFFTFWQDHLKSALESYRRK